MKPTKIEYMLLDNLPLGDSSLSDGVKWSFGKCEEYILKDGSVMSFPIVSRIYTTTRFNIIITQMFFVIDQMDDDRDSHIR